MKTQLDHAYEHEKNRAERIWLTQPLGGGVVRDFTWRQAFDEARRMAAHLRSLELPPGSRIAIFSKNTAWWILADLAIWMAGHVSVPIYPTLTPDSIRAILEHSGARLVFIGKLDGWAAMAPGIPQKLARIALPLAPAGIGPAWEEILSRTAPLEHSPRREPDELATLIYTSGSTGAPKGVMHSFRTMCAARVLIDLAQMTPEARLISYLPLAHVAERACLETTNLIVGYRVFFAESLDTFLDDVKRARPTIFGSVPRLWLKLQSGVFSKMPPQKLAKLLRIPLLGSLVRHKVRAGLGLDQVHTSITGSAPIPNEVIAWYGSLGLELLDLYAMTENFAVSHMQRRGRVVPGFVGSPVPGVEQRLGQGGEVLVKSPGNMIGYFEAPELTRETIDAEGWLHTGDRGALDGAGNLRITGRVKEQFKTSKGKYVAPAPLETRLMAHPHVEQACVSGTGLPQPFALVVLSPAARERTKTARGELASELRQLRGEVNAKLDPHERLEKLVVVDEEWTIENGLLTPTLKLKRSAIESRYGPRASSWYESAEEIVWM